MNDIPKYRTIVVDPPWNYNDEKPDGYKEKLRSKIGPDGSLHGHKNFNPDNRHIITRSITDDYDGVMDVEEVMKFDLIKKLADDDCILFLWTTNRFLFSCAAIMEAWGFSLGQGGRTMVWHKNKAASSPMTWQQNAEFIIVGSNGKSKWRSTLGLEACFWATNEGHSIKPAKFYRMIRECTYEPRIDVFARRRHDGFDAWGNQVEVRENDLVSNWPKQKVVKLGTGELHMDIIENEEERLLI